MQPHEPADSPVRARIIQVAETWLGTPYLSNAMVRGRRGGVDCAMLLVAVYNEVGIVPKEFDPRPYPPYWHVHRDVERYMNFVRSFAEEFEGPPLPGDVVLFKIARTFAHGGIVVDWPRVLHARMPDPVFIEDISMNNTGKHCLAHTKKKFFTIFQRP